MSAPDAAPGRDGQAIRGGWTELACVAAAAAVLTACLTYPIAFNMGRVGRVDNGDGQFSIWNVAWVARTLVADPRHLFDANIFYPHTGTLAYSEANLAAGALAVPVYWATRNPYAAHNSAVLLAFLLTAVGTYYLVRHLTRDRRGAAVAAICFAFCPFVFAHLPHIQLLMTAGLPFTMLAFHRLIERPSAGRGAALGAVMAAAALGCGYYGVFAILMVGFGVLVVMTMRGLWTSGSLWVGLIVGAVVAVALVAPAFLPYRELQRQEGFGRSLDDSLRYSANWSAYLASSAHAHAWMLEYLPRWNEAAFPGFVATIFGIAGLWVARRVQRGEVVVLYGGLAAIAAWASFGPAAGLYSVLYSTLPMFAWLRAPSRFGVVVCFALSVLAGVAISTLLRGMRDGRRAGLAAAGLAAVAAAELIVPLRIPEVPPVENVYRMLAASPRGPVIEMPFYYPEVGLFQHAKYMLASTSHWMPLVNGYSDFIPPDFTEHVLTIAPFPSRDAFKLLEPNRVRYAVFHMYGYNTENRNDVLARLKQFEQYLRPLYMDEGTGTRLYEIVGFPP
jgi:hypothetical protein